MFLHVRTRKEVGGGGGGGKMVAPPSRKVWIGLSISECGGDEGGVHH